MPPTVAAYTFDVGILTPLDYVRSRSQDIYSRTGDGSSNAPWFVADQTILAWLSESNNDNEAAAMVCEAMAIGFANLSTETKQVDVLRKYLSRSAECRALAVSLRNSQRAGPDSPQPTGAGFGFIQTPSLSDYPNSLPGRCGPGVSLREDNDF